MTRSAPARITHTHTLPATLQVGVDHLLRLQADGTLSVIDAKLQIERQGGYSGLHLFVVAVIYLTSGTSGGIQSFTERNADHLRAIAALLGFSSLPTGSSISRLMSAVQEAEFRPFLRWLLREVPGFAAVMSDPAVATWDACGDPWHVFDYDPTADTVYRRPLKRGGGSAERRRSRDLAKPGYAGRKRGDAVFRRGALQHAGSAFWLDCRLEAGHGDTKEGFAETVVAARAAAPAGSRAVLRCDGEFAGVRYHRLCADAEIDFLTRLCRYNLFDQEAVQRRLNACTWWETETATGIARASAELGQMLLHADEGTVDANGAAVAPVAVRVIAVRSPTGDEAGRGVKIGAEEVQLFATSLNPVAWPANDVIELLQGRSAIENRFAQEDREFSLARIFSYTPAGQELVTGIGLFVWNLQISLGVAASPPLPADRPEQRCRSDRMAVVSPLFSTPQVPAGDTVEPESTPVDCGEPTPAAAEQQATTAIECNPAPVRSSPDVEDLRVRLESLLDGAAWRNLGPGWHRERGLLQLRCPNGERLRLFYVESADLPTKAGQPRQNRAGYRTDVGACDGCPLRPQCTSTTKPNGYKFVAKNLPGPAAREAMGVLAAIREAEPKPPAARPRRRVPHGVCQAKPVSLATQETTTKILQFQDVPAPGAFRWERPRFRPREARRRARDLALAGVATIQIIEGAEPSIPWCTRPTTRACRPGSRPRTD